MTDKEIRDLIRSEIRSQMIDVPKESKIKDIAKKEAEKETKKVSEEFLTKKEVKDMIKNTMNAYHKWMWEKKNMWMSQI